MEGLHAAPLSGATRRKRGQARKREDILRQPLGLFTFIPRPAIWLDAWSAWPSARSHVAGMRRSWRNVRGVFSWPPSFIERESVPEIDSRGFIGTCVGGPVPREWMGLPDML